jgi:hypothetical protein
MRSPPFRPPNSKPYLGVLEAFSQEAHSVCRGIPSRLSQKSCLFIRKTWLGKRVAGLLPVLSAKRNSNQI